MTKKRDFYIRKGKTMRGKKVFHLFLAVCLMISLLSGIVPTVTEASSNWTTCSSGTVSWQMIHDNPQTYYWLDDDGYYCALTGTKSGKYYYVTLYRPEKDHGTELRYLRQDKDDDSGSEHEWDGPNAKYTGGKLYMKGSSSGGSSSEESTGTTIADGTYTATSNSSFNKDGETYKATVTVTVQNGKITSITATGPTKSSDNKEYFEEALSKIASNLKGTTATASSGSQADTVSGATKSANLIREAIDLALSSGASESSTTTYYTVTFNANGHGTAPSAQTVASGNKVTEPSDPAASGYVFGGWYTDKGCTSAYNFNSTVSKSFTLYAKWTYQSSGDDSGSSGSTTNLADGTYTGTSTSSYKKDGETYKATVTVTVKDGKITSITASGPTTSDNKNYFSKALNKIISAITGEDATLETANNIDSVSGATNSAKLIREAIQDALKDAPESSDSGSSSSTTGNVTITNPNTVSKDGLNLSKTLSYDTSSDTYTITLEAWADSSSSGGSYTIDSKDKYYSYSELCSGKYYYLYKGNYYQVDGYKYTHDKKTYYCGIIKVNGTTYYLDKDGPTTKLSDKPGDDDSKKAYEADVDKYEEKGEKAPLYVASGSSGTSAGSSAVLKDAVNTTAFDVSSATASVKSGSGATAKLTGGNLTVSSYDYAGNAGGTHLKVTISGLTAKTTGTVKSNSSNAGVYASSSSSSALISITSPTAVIPETPVADTVTYTVTFQVKNGAWNDKTTADKVVTLTGTAGDALYLDSTQIPQAGARPAAGHVAGGWNSTPSDTRVITQDTTYIYTYDTDSSSIEDGVYGDYSVTVKDLYNEGFAPYNPIVVVTVEDGIITDISMDADTDKNSRDCMDIAVEGIRDQLKGQPVSAVDSVDAISGATISSDAIVEAIQKALADGPKGPYTLTVQDEDGNVIEQHMNVKYGTRTAYVLEDPAKPDDDYSYTFKGWVETFDTFVTRDRTYTAIYDQTAIEKETSIPDGVYGDYSVTVTNGKSWMNYKLLATLDVEDGVITGISMDADTDMSEDNAEYLEEALAYLKEQLVGKPASTETLANVDATSGATFSTKAFLEEAENAFEAGPKGPYTVAWTDQNEDAVGSESNVRYGTRTTNVVPETPEKENATFVKWLDEFSTFVTEDASYKAEFDIEEGPSVDSWVYLAGYTTSLNGTIEMNFYMDMSDDIAADETAYMQFELPGANHTTDKIMLTDARKSVRGGKTYYVFSAGVAAKNMVDDITATFYYSDGKKSAGPYAYTVQSYCEYIINPKNGYDAESVALAKAMLNYGSAAQRFHDSTVADDKLANVNLSEEDKTLADVSLDDDYLAETNGSCTGFSWKGTSVMTTTTTSLRHFFTVDSDLSNYTFKANGTTLTPKAYNKTMYYVEIEGIRARALDTPIQMTVTNTSDNTSYTLNYSVYTNIKSVMESNNQTDIAKDLMKSMYYYCEAAKEYFATR